MPRNTLSCFVISFTLLLPNEIARAKEIAGPASLNCVQISTVGCVDGVCVGDPVSSDFVIAFNFAERQFRSAWGRGRITQIRDRPDGSHAIIVSSPPAGAEMTFSKDWLQARNPSAGYKCSISEPDQDDSQSARGMFK